MSYVALGIDQAACESAGGIWVNGSCEYAPPPEDCEYEKMVEYPLSAARGCDCPPGTFYEEFADTFRCSEIPEPPTTPDDPGTPGNGSSSESKTLSTASTVVIIGAAAAVGAGIVLLIGRSS
jgi:hypothetical protein